MRLPRACSLAVLAALATPAAAQVPEQGIVVRPPAPAGTDQPRRAPDQGGGQAGEIIPIPYSYGLPAPDLDVDAQPADFLQAARRALAAGRVGEAQEALERAESRALDRAVRPSRASLPSEQPLVERIAGARAALTTGDRMAVLQIIDDALAAEPAEPVETQ